MRCTSATLTARRSAVARRAADRRPQRAERRRECSRSKPPEFSGGAALRAGYLAVASGAVENRAGARRGKIDRHDRHGTHGRALSQSGRHYEAVHGATLPALAAPLMRRYERIRVELGAFENFTINAHTNGAKNENAMSQQDQARRVRARPDDRRPGQPVRQRPGR
ncbi:MAG: hypothetical protein U0521_04845 [Anaerolineae bacterium]